MSTKVFLVFGATGRQGEGVLQALQKRILSQNRNQNVEWSVRVFVRPSSLESKGKALEAKGYEVIGGELDDDEALRRGMKGVYGVFCNLDFWSMGLEKEIAIGCKIADIAKESGVEHFIYSSLEDCSRDSGGKLYVSHFHGKTVIQSYIEKLKLPSSFVKYSFYFENFRTPYGSPKWDAEKSELVIRFPLGGKVFAMVPVVDVGEVVVRIWENKLVGKTIGLASEALKGEEIANIFAKVTGKKSRFEEAPLSSLPSGDNLNMWAYKQDFAHKYEEYVMQTKEIYPEALSLEKWLATENF